MHCGNAQPSLPIIDWRALRLALVLKLLTLVIMLCSAALLPSYNVSHLISGHGPLTVWDALWFNDISMHGYDHEQKYAFYPGVPLLLALTRDIFSIAPLAAEATVIAIANAATVLGVAILAPVVRHAAPLVATPWVVAVVLGQAAPFLTVGYTEPFFILANCVALRMLLGPGGVIARPALLPLLVVPLAPAVALRSNGAVLAGYALYPGFHHTVTLLHPARRTLRQVATAAWTSAVGAGIAVIVGLAGAVLTQVHATAALCPGRPWCGGSVYSFVQAECWGVGLLSSFRSDQLGNILLAAPALIITATAIAAPRSIAPHPSDTLAHIRLLVAVQCVGLAGLAAVMHINVYARLLASTQPLVLLTAMGWGRATAPVLALWSAFGLLGCVLFATHLPFT